MSLELAEFLSALTAGMTEILKAGRQNIPDSVFEIPAGITRQTMPDMGRGGRGRFPYGRLNAT